MKFPQALENQFEFIEHLPSGKIHEHFRVRDRETGRKEFLLRMLPDLFGNMKNVVKDFHDYYLKFSNITNRSYIPVVYSVSGVVGGSVYVLEEIISGLSFLQYIGTQSGSDNFRHDVSEIVTRVCEALHYAHQKGIFHLCITPEDIIVAEENPRRVKLVGFGTQIFAKTSHLSSFSDHCRHYLAPEILDGAEPQPSGDIYSLCAVVEEVFPELFEGSGLLSRCLSANALDRPSKARVLGQELKRLLEVKTARPETIPGEIVKSGGLHPILNIRTDPAGAAVRVNGREVGATTDSGFTMPWKPGMLIEISKSGYEIETLDFRSLPESSQITVKLTSALRLHISPWGSQVLVDGKLLGVAGRDGFNVPWDGHRIEIEKAGYKRETLTFESPPDDKDACVELQPMFTAPVPRWHPLEIGGYFAGGLSLLLLPMAMYMGIGGAGSEKKLSELETALTQRGAEITQLKKSAETEKTQNERGMADLSASLRKTEAERKQFESDVSRLKKLAESEKVQKEREIANLSDTVRGIEQDKHERESDIARMKKLWETEKDQKDKEIQALRTDNAKLRGIEVEKQHLEQQIARLKSAPVLPYQPSRLMNIDPSLNEQLLKATMKGVLGPVEDLLKRGADPNTRSYYGDTPLMLAAQWSHFFMVKLLLKYGANPKLERKGSTAEDFARNNKQTAIADLLKAHKTGQPLH